MLYIHFLRCQRLVLKLSSARQVGSQNLEVWEREGTLNQGVSVQNSLNAYHVFCFSSSAHPSQLMCLRSLSFADVLCKSRFNEFLQCWFVVASFALFSQQRTETSRFLEAPRLYTYQTKQTRNSRPQTRFVCRLVCAYQSVGISYYACYVFPHRFLPTNFRVHPNLPNLQILISYCELLSQEGSGRVCAKSCPFHGKTETL